MISAASGFILLFGCTQLGCVPTCWFRSTLTDGTSLWHVIPVWWHRGCVLKLELRLAVHISQADLGTGTSAAFPGQQVNARPQLIAVSLTQPATAMTDEASASLGGSLAGAAATATAAAAGSVNGGRAGSFPG